MSHPTTNALVPRGFTVTETVAASSASEAIPSGVALLTRRLAAGDEEAFRKFHKQYFDRLYQFLLVVTRGQEHEAQEALQETLLRVVRYAREFETEDAFWCWLKVVARSAARDRGRKHRRYLALLQRFASYRGDERQEDDRLRALLEDSLNELDALDRRLIERKYLDGATVKELSADTGLTDKAVESRLLPLRRHLRVRLVEKLRLP